MAQPEHEARARIDEILAAASWHICNVGNANIHASVGVTIREFPLPGHGFADYLLYVNGKAAGVIEAKKEGVTLTGAETQPKKYTQGLPSGLPRWGNPLPVANQSTGVETRFTNGMDPQPRSRPVFACHRPELFADALTDSDKLSAPEVIAQESVEDLEAAMGQLRLNAADLGADEVEAAG